MARRILFACVECDTALMWPVDAEPMSTTDSVGETTYAEIVDPDGRATIELHPASSWKAKLEPSGVITCPHGHAVGVRKLNGKAANARLSLLRDRVVTREMRGRV